MKRFLESNSVDINKDGNGIQEYPISDCYAFSIKYLLFPPE